VLGDPDAVDHERHQVQPGQVGASSSARARSVAATKRREIADFDVPVASCSMRLPTGSSPAW
jgi:hypothetical protein